MEQFISVPSFLARWWRPIFPRQSFPQTRSRRGNAKCFNLSAKGNQPRTLPHFWESAFRRIRTHGARRTGLDSPSGSTIALCPGRIRFGFLAEHYLRADFGADAVRPKSANTISHVEHIVRAYLVPRFGNEIAEDIKPLDIQRWFKSLHETGGLAWTTIAKMRGVMSRIYKVGILHEHVAKNPAQHVETRSKTAYKAIVIAPAQTLAILKALPSPLHFPLVLTCAATALRASEILAVRWSDVLWNEGRIRISKRCAKGKDGETKTEASDGYVPLHPILAAHLRAWRGQSPYAKDGDFVFPSLKARGRVPLSASVFVADHLRPAAEKAGVPLEASRRFGVP